jgi:Ca2+-binding EF-hand superfamily protein
MTNVLTTPRRILLSVTAFGLASLGMAGAASADPDVSADVELEADIQVSAADGVRVVPQHRRATPDDGRYRIQPYPYPIKDDRYRIQPYPNPGRRPVDPYRSAMWRFDSNRNGRIDAHERKSFWTYMAGTGIYGRLSSEEVGRFGHLAHYFDVNDDGRLVGAERVGMDKLNDSLRLFKMLDRNGDLRLSAYEVGFSALAPRFYRMDLNRDRRVSRQEVRDEVLRSFRAGECGVVAYR